MSIGKLAAGPTAGRYYVEQAAQGREDYYAGEGEAPGTWIGVGATSLALRGEVTEGGIGLLLDARDPGSSARLRPWRALARGRARDGGHCRGAARRDRALFAAAPHRRGDPHRLSILGDSAASNIDTLVLQQLDDALVGERAVRGFAVN